jgi:hypothetical protein
MLAKTELGVSDLQVIQGYQQLPQLAFGETEHD